MTLLVLIHKKLVWGPLCLWSYFLALPFCYVPAFLRSRIKTMPHSLVHFFWCHIFAISHAKLPLNFRILFPAFFAQLKLQHFIFVIPAFMSSRISMIPHACLHHFCGFAFLRPLRRLSSHNFAFKRSRIFKLHNLEDFMCHIITYGNTGNTVIRSNSLLIQDNPH